MKKSLILGSVCSCAIGLASMTANASVVYTYTGNTFTDIQDSDPPAGTFTMSDFVSLSFVVPDLLINLGVPDTGVPVNILPITYTASNGRTTFTETSPLTVEVIQVITNSSGSITGWHIHLATGDANLQLGEQGEDIYTGFNTLSSERDGGNRTECTQRAESDASCQVWLVDYGSNTNNPGIWTVSSVPIPAAIWLFGPGLLGLIGIARRKKA